MIAAFGVCLGGCVNVVLDPLLILPRFAGLGAAGAGLATAVSNTLAALFFLVWLIFGKRRTVLRLSPRYLHQTRRYLADIVRIGIPASVQYALTVVSVAALSKFVSGYGTAAVAALGIVKKLDQLPLYFSIGASNGLLPLLARRRAAFRFGTTLTVCFSLLCLVAYECFAPQLAGLFIQDSETIAYGAKFLRLMVVAMPLMSVCYPLIVQFQAMGCARQSLICSVLRKGVLDIPLLFLLDRLLPLYGCMLVQPIVDAVSLAVGLYFYQKLPREAVQIEETARSSAGE